MSIAMSMSRATMIRRGSVRGDPGLGSILKGIGKVAGGFLVGGPVGALAGAASALAPALGGGTQQQLPPVVQQFLPQQVQPLSVGPQGGGFGIGGTITIPGVGTISGGTGVGVSGFGPGNIGAVGTPGACVPGMKGVRLNKTGYHLKNGTYIAPGTKCVRVRRRNPLNPRALSKAMSRVVSAKKAASTLNRISIRSGCAKCK